MALLRGLWPAKASPELHFLSGCTEDHAQRVLTGKVGLSSDMIYSLLHSPHGLAVLREMMAGCREPWWLKLQVALEDIEYEMRRKVLLASIEADQGARK